MSRLLEYPGQLLSRKQLLGVLGYRNKGTLRRLIREHGFPPASVRAGRRGQRWRAGLVDDWIRRQEKAAGVTA